MSNGLLVFKLGLPGTVVVYALVFNLAFVEVRKVSIGGGLPGLKSDW